VSFGNRNQPADNWRGRFSQIVDLFAIRFIFLTADTEPEEDGTRPPKYFVTFRIDREALGAHFCELMQFHEKVGLQEK